MSTLPRVMPSVAPKGAAGMSLLDLAVGQSALVSAIRAHGELGRRLRDMGLLPGVRLTVNGRAPLGCPMSISLEGYDLSLRCQEAGQVLVEPAH